MKTFANQTTEDQYLTLPYQIANEVLTVMRKNGKATIHLITTHFVDGILKQTIKYNY